MSAPFSVAVLSPTPTWPSDFGNRKRIRRICEGLRERGARVEFFLYALEDDWRDHYPLAALEAMRSQWDDVHVIVPSVPYHPPPQGEDHLIDEWWDPAVATYLGWYLRSRRPDALIVNYAYLSKALELAPSGCLRILDTHDRVGGRRQVLRDLGLRPEFFHTTPEEEGKALDRADLVLAIKEEEAEYFSSISDTPVLPVPFVEDTHGIEREPDPEGYLRVGLLGARNNVNVTNVSKFLNVALPLFRDEMAPVKIVLAGSMCVDLEGYRPDPMVTTLGYLADISEFYRSVDVAVVPVERSTGQKIRVGEALGYGIPVLAHQHAFEGYPASHRFHRLRDFDAIARATVAIAFERSLLTDLATSSEAAQIVASQHEDHAIGTLALAIEQTAPVSYFLVPVDRLIQEPEFRLHVASMIGLAAGYSRVRLVLTGSGGIDHAEPGFDRFLTFVQRFASLLAHGSDARAGSRLFDGAIEDLDVVLRTPEAVHAWCYDPELLPVLAGIDCDVLTTEGFSGRVDGSGAAEGFVATVAGQVTCGRIHADGTGLRYEAPDVYSVAPFGAWVASELPEMASAQATESALVLADPWDQPLASLALAVLRHKGMKTTLVVPDGTDLSFADGWATGRDGWELTVAHASDARAWLRASVPAVTLDCAPTSAEMSVLVAIAHLHALRGRGSAPWRLHSIPGGWGLLGTIRAISDYVGDGRVVVPATPPRDEDGTAHFFSRQSERLIPHLLDLRASADPPSLSGHALEMGTTPTEAGLDH